MGQNSARNPRSMLSKRDPRSAIEFSPCTTPDFAQTGEGPEGFPCKCTCIIDCCSSRFPLRFSLLQTFFFFLLFHGIVSLTYFISALLNGTMTQPLEDEEKGNQPTPVVKSLSPKPSSQSSSPKNAFGRFNNRLNSLEFFESRGIERVPLEERHGDTTADYMQMGLLWFSTNITANNMALGMLGPLSYGLGFVDAALCATFGALLGAAGVAYMGTFGPASGNRTMVYPTLSNIFDF